MTKTYRNILQNNQLDVPESWAKLKCIDMHTCGEPLRVILSGYPKLQGNTILEYRNYFKNNLDYIRTSLMFEPRGHADMYGCILCPPEKEDSDFGILFLHNEGYSTMCGHAIIAISHLAIHMNWIDVQNGENQLKIDAPCGQITSFIHVENGNITGVRFQCVPSFVIELNLEVETEQWGNIIYDLAYGGAFYAYVDLEINDLNLQLNSKDYRKLIACGMDIKHAVIENNKKILHPFEEDLSFLYGTIFIDKAQDENNHSRNVCIFADGEVDRCPTGSGVSGRMAIHYLRNEIEIGQKFQIESIIGTLFHGSVIREVPFGNHDAIIPEVYGTAHIIGEHTFLIDSSDPLKEGFILR